MPEQDTAIRWETRDGITFVRFTSDEVRELNYIRQATAELRKLAVSVGGKVVLSLRNVQYISTSGVAALLLLNRLLRTVHGRLKVCDTQPLVVNTLFAGGVDRILDVHNTEADAVDAFALDR